ARAMVVTIVTVAGVMVVNMVRYAGVSEVTGDISLGFDDMLKMGADQRYDAGDLGKEKQPQQPRANAPLGGWGHHFVNGLVPLIKYQPHTQGKIANFDCQKFPVRFGICSRDRCRSFTARFMADEGGAVGECIQFPHFARSNDRRRPSLWPARCA